VVTIAISLCRIGRAGDALKEDASYLHDDLAGGLADDGGNQETY
jgi:hypothetical protein